MGLKDTIKNFVSSEVADEELELTDEEIEESSNYEAPNAKGVGRMFSDVKMVLFELRSFEEAHEIANHLKMKRAAVVNLHKLDDKHKQRTIDFLTGVIYALDGVIQKIGHNVILCSPKSMPVQGEITLESDEE